MSSAVPNLSFSVSRVVRKQLSMRKELSEVTLPLWLQYLERWLERAGTTFFVGEEITICDLVIYTRMKWLRRGVRFYAKARSTSNSLRFLYSDWTILFMCACIAVCSATGAVRCGRDFCCQSTGGHHPCGSKLAISALDLVGTGSASRAPYTNDTFL